MVKWGRRLLGRTKASSHRKQDEGRRSTRSSYNDKRQYDYSDDSYSDVSQSDGEDYYEEDPRWDARDDDDDTRKEEDCDDNEDGEEPREDDGSRSELVTRDQVLDELRAQAAAEALGKSLEKMGYNLDNCDSFYSLSENDEIDQRYKISQKTSEVSAGQKSGASSPRKKRRSKSKKKKNKASSSRYLTDDDDKSSKYHARQHSFGDYETNANSSSDESDSTFDEATTFTTGRDSALTGKTSRYSRFTGKKSARTRKSSKSRKHKKRSRDHDTYYSRGTEWTPDDDSSYGKTLGQNSTLSSVSSSEDSDMDLNTEYTEPTRKRDRNRKKEMPRHGTNDKKKRNMKAIDEKQSEDEKSKDSLSRTKGKRYGKQQAQRSLAMRRRSDSSRFSNSSQIGAMRSLESFSDTESQLAEKDAMAKDDKQKGTSSKKENSEKLARSPSLENEPVASEDDNDKTSQKKTESSSRSGRSRKNPKTEPKEVAAEDEGEALSDLSEAEGTKKKRKKKSREGKPPRADESTTPDREKAVESDADDDSNYETQTAKQRQEPTDDGDPDEKPKRNKHPKRGKKDEEKAPEESVRHRKDSKKRTDNARPERTRKSSPTKIKDAVGATQPSLSEPANANKKFWPRQFLSLRKKKNDDSRHESEEENDNDSKQVGEDPDDRADSIKDKKRSRKVNRERSESPESRMSRDSRERSPSPECVEEDAPSSKRQTSPLRRQSRGKKKPSESEKSSAKERELQKNKEDTPEVRDSSVMRGDAAPPKNIEKKNIEKKEQQESQPTSSSGSLSMLELATMAAMIPLAPLAVPFAAAYGCYTAERTQSFITNGTACVGRTCQDAGSLQCSKQDSEKVKEKDGDDHTRASTRASSRKKKSKAQKKQEDATKNDDERSSAASKKSSKSAKKHDIIEKEIIVPAKPETRASKSSAASASSRSKKALTKILPQRTSTAKYDPPKTHIQEAPEGFESFLPGPLEAQGLPMSGMASQKGQPLSTMVSPADPKTLSQKLQQSSDTKVPRKKNKRWMSKLPFGSHKKAGDKASSHELPEAEPDGAHQQTPSDTKSRAPLFLNMANKRTPVDVSENVDVSTRALASFWAETPTFATKAKPKAEKKESQMQEEELAPFACAKTSTVCGDLDQVVGDDLEKNQSLLSDFENIALDALRKKSQQDAVNKGAAFDPSKATQEDLLKYYDLGQTLSDVMDARQTLEQAYGMHSGGNSFDHTIDEQLVELLTHMAEMDQDDVVEIEAAIKKLKRHARKLGISERDLLFSVKSAEESMNGEENYLKGDINQDQHSSFSGKLIDAFEGYFGRDK